MLASTSVFSRYAKRLFGGNPGASRLRRADLRRRKDAPCYNFSHAAEVMESKSLLSAAAFGSVMGLASTGGIGASSVATDNAGHTFVAGGFSGTANFNPNGAAVTLTAQGIKDAYVAEYAPDHTLLWVQQMGGSGASVGGSSIKVDSGGNVYVAGGASAAAHFGSTTLAAGGYVEKLSGNGAIQWAHNLGSGSTSGVGVAVDSSGNVYGLGETTPANVNYQITKFSSAGTTRWSEAINAQGQMLTAGFAVDGSGNVYLGGAFTGTVNFSPTGRSHYVSAGPSESAFVLKLNTSGAFQWVSPFVGQTVGSTNGWSAGESLALDGIGNIIVAGSFGGPVDFDPGSGTSILSGSGGFITKLNSSGGLVWAEGLQTSSTVLVGGLAVDSAGSVYASGNFYGNTIALNPGDSTQTWTNGNPGSPDTFVTKLDASGNFNWGAVLGGPGTSINMGLAVDSSGIVHLVGYFYGTVNFNPDPNGTPYDLTSTASNIRSAYLLELSQS
jgi:hypothetical protein